MGGKIRLQLLMICMPIILGLSYIIIQKINELQKVNDYIRCKSVTRVAKLTGKLKTNFSLHKICKYHLD